MNCQLWANRIVCGPQILQLVNITGNFFCVSSLYNDVFQYQLMLATNAVYIMLFAGVLSNLLWFIAAVRRIKLGISTSGVCSSVSFIFPPGTPTVYTYYIFGERVQQQTELHLQSKYGILLMSVYGMLCTNSLNVVPRSTTVTDISSSWLACVSLNVLCIVHCAVKRQAVWNGAIKHRICSCLLLVSVRWRKYLCSHMCAVLSA